jgi:hypothetical protein
LWDEEVGMDGCGIEGERRLMIVVKDLKALNIFQRR